jgi:hypothetical protein
MLGLNALRPTRNFRNSVVMANLLNFLLNRLRRRHAN